MTLQTDVTNAVASIFSTDFQVVEGQVVPESEDINLTNGAVTLDATYLYADLADSSGAAHRLPTFATAKVVRAYLNAATRIIKSKGGHVRSFDGDRVMGIFVGGSKSSNAVRAALGIDWAVDEVISPKFKAKYPKSSQLWDVSHGVGIDTGKATLVRGGVRGENDVVSIGAAPNVAAKLSSLRVAGKTTFITANVYNHLKEPMKVNLKGDQSIWTKLAKSCDIGGTHYAVYASGWWRKP